MLLNIVVVYLTQLGVNCACHDSMVNQLQACSCIKIKYNVTYLLVTVVRVLKKAVAPVCFLLCEISSGQSYTPSTDLSG